MINNIIEVDENGVPVSPQILLAKRNGEKIGTIINVANVKMANHMNSADEITFDVYKYMDGIKCEFWDDIRDFRLICLPYYDKWYELSVSVSESDEVYKSITGTALYEAELSQLTLNEVEINSEDDIDRDDYVTTYFYDPKNTSGSMLHRILKDKAMHYSIYHVDSTLYKVQRVFSFDNETIKDALDDIASEIECLFVFGEHDYNDGRIHRTISAYDLKDTCLDCGYRGVENGVCPKCGSKNYIEGYGIDSGVFISRENLSDDISYESNSSDVKNCFRLSAGDDDMTAAVININPSGSQYIWYFSDDMYDDMSDELSTAIKTHLSKIEEYNNSHEFYIYNSENNSNENNIVEKYNKLIEKYSNYAIDESLQKLVNPVTGYANLTTYFYEALDFQDYLQTSMLPSANPSDDTSAEEQASNLTKDKLSPIGVQNLSKTSSYTAKSKVLNRAKLFIDTSRYKVTIIDDSSDFADGVWTGRFKVESLSDEDDLVTTSTVTIVFNESYETYLLQCVETAMAKNDSDPVGAVNLFKLSSDNFAEQLKRYSVDGLSNLSEICDSCLTILQSEGVGDPDDVCYSTIYYPYYEKNLLIADELQVREKEIEVFTNDDSTGIVDIIKNERKKSSNELDLFSNLSDELLAEFSSFRRDQAYSNSNYISDGLTNLELINNAREFLNTAKKDLIESATMQHTISASLYNLMLLMQDTATDDSKNILGTMDSKTIVTQMDEYIAEYNPLFAPLISNFKLGNWIILEVDEKIYKLRLTDYTLDFDDIENLDVTFSDVIIANGYLSDVESILSSASSISSSYSYTQRQALFGAEASKEWSAVNTNGYVLDQRKIINSSSDENIVIDKNGILMRKMNDVGDYDDEQIRVINKGLYYTNDNWKTVGTGIGSFTYTNPETGETIDDYGVIAKTIIGQLILGKNLKLFNDNGSIRMDENGFILTTDNSGSGTNLFTVQKDNGDGSYDRYIYVNDNGEVVINGNQIEVGDQLTVKDYIDNNIVIQETRYTGEWTEGLDYLNTDNYLDIVNYNGSSYMCLQTHVASTDNKPPNTEYWSLIASKGESSILLQITTPDGTNVFDGDVTSITMQGTLLDGSYDVTDAATYRWSVWDIDTKKYVEVNGETDSKIVVSNNSVDSYASYKLTAYYNDNTYVALFSLFDKVDPVQVEIFSSFGSQIVNEDTIGALYAKVTKSGEEYDVMKSEVFLTEPPSSATSGDYYYNLDKNSKSVALMNYDGTTWNKVDETFKAKYIWSWRDENGDIVDSINGVSLPTSGKIIYIDSNDINEKIIANIEVEV